MVYLAIRSPINMFFAYFTTFMFGMCISSFMSSPRRHWDSLVVLILHFSIGAFIWIEFSFLTFFLTFFLPFFLSQMLGAYLFYAQHNFPGVVFKDRCGWTYEGAAMESSSYMKMNPFMQWCTGNIGFHHIHHLNCRIPFYNLPKAMKGIPELQQAKTTTLKPGDIIACFRLKVWDPECRRMVGYKEIYRPAANVPIPASL